MTTPERESGLGLVLAVLVAALLIAPFSIVNAQVETV